MIIKFSYVTIGIRTRDIYKIHIKNILAQFCRMCSPRQLFHNTTLTNGSHMQEHDGCTNFNLSEILKEKIICLHRDLISWPQNHLVFTNHLPYLCIISIVNIISNNKVTLKHRFYLLAVSITFILVLGIWRDLIACNPVSFCGKYLLKIYRVEEKIGFFLVCTFGTSFWELVLQLPSLSMLCLN